jgi:hypothetical protein
MFRKGANIRIAVAESVLWLLLLTLGLMIYNNLNNNSSERGKEPIRAESIINQSSATIIQGFQILDFHKNWIPNKDNFKLLGFTDIQFVETRKAVQRIFHFQSVYRKTKVISVSSSHLHLFPDERDDLPSVS